MVKVKICGITNKDDAAAAVRTGCDALGFVFYKKSPRYINASEAAKIINSLPRRIIKVGVFAGARENTIKKIAKICRLDMLQFHGAESVDFCRRFSGYKIIKAFQVKNKISLDQVLGYDVFAYLFDSYSAVAPGGTGKSFDWKLIRHIHGIKRPIFLSGGLTEKNVSRAIKLTRPDWVDVSSSVEFLPGKKDLAKMGNFIKAAKGARLR